MNDTELNEARRLSDALSKDPLSREKWVACCKAHGRVPLYSLPKEASDYIAEYQEASDELKASVPNWGMFDRMYCIHYAPLIDRVPKIVSELKRVGIWGRENFEFVETVRTEYEKKIDSNGMTDSQVNIGLNHCEIIQRALANGYNRILILEDDIRFLKDTGLIARILADTPDDQDVVLYDKMVCAFPSDFVSLCKNYQYTKGFCGYDVMWSAACYSLSRRGMEVIAQEYEKRITCADNPTNIKTLNRVFSYVNICCQEYLPDSQFADNSLHHHNFYLNQGLDYSMYNMNENKNEIPVVPIVVVGMNRGKMTCEVMRRIKLHVKNADVRFIVSTDRSNALSERIIQEFVRDEIKEDVVFVKTDANRYGLGAALNNGIRKALEMSDCVMVVENDMLLERDIDVRRYLDLLSNTEVGIVDFKHVERTLTHERRTIAGHEYVVRKGQEGVCLDDAVRFGAFIAHKRFFEAVKILENKTASECEAEFIGSYEKMPTQERNEKRVVSVNDVDLYHDTLNGLGHVFYHVGQDGEHKWDVDRKYDYLQVDSLEGPDTIRWKNYFDKIYCIHNQTHSNRSCILENELSRIGMLDSGIFEWWIYDDTENDVTVDGKSSFLRAHRIAYEKLLEHAVANGETRVLVVEDDMLFLHGQDSIAQTLSILPQSSDCVQFDKFVFCEQIDSYRKAVQEVDEHGFVKRTNSNWWPSTGCSFYTNVGMLSLLKSLHDHPDSTTDECVHFMSCRKYVARENIAIHDLSGKNSIFCHDEDISKYIRSYADIGIDTKRYVQEQDKREIIKPDDAVMSLRTLFANRSVLFASNGDYSSGSIWNKCRESYAHLAGMNFYNVGPSKYGREAFLEIFEEAIKRNFKYVIYVDCDCFIVNDYNLWKSFEEFIETDAAFMGVTDGGVVCHRACNPMSINPFLMFANVDKVKRYWGGNSFVFDPSIKFHGWNDQGAAMNSWMRSYVAYRDYRLTHPEYKVPYATSEANLSGSWKDAWGFDFGFKQWEPYYDIFLGMQAPDCGCRYFIGRDYPCEADPSGMTTALYHFGEREDVDLDDESRLICLHTWLSRCVMWGQKDRVERIERVIDYAQKLKKHLH